MAERVDPPGSAQPRRVPEAAGAPTAAPLLEVREIAKSYGNVHALRGASMSVNAGEVVALIGDNGAGKSTLTKIIAGVVPADSGQFFFDGDPVSIGSVRDAQARGVEVVYQDLAQAPDLTVYENLYLGREPVVRGLLGKIGYVDRKLMRSQARDAISRLGSRIPSLSTPVAALSGGQKQAVAVARAVMWASKAVLMDEPTAALGAHQTAQVYEAIRHAADSGIAVVIVSHDIPKMIEFADRLVMMRHGKVVASLPARSATLTDVLHLMISGEAA